MKKNKVKNVGILTLPLVNNYGGILQAFALKKVINSMGLDTTLIDYRRVQPKRFKIIEMMFKNALKKTIFRHRKMKIAETPLMSKSISINAELFIANELVPKTGPIFNFKDLKNLNKSIDAFVVGSDQVWRPDYTPNIRRYFLDFVDPSKLKVSYAASFGTDKLKFNKSDLEYCKSNLAKFNAISVRENSGIEIVNDLFSCKSEFVLDPTMLLDKSDYLSLCDKYKTTSSDGNLFCYILDKNKFNQNVIDTVSNKLSLKAFEIKPKDVDFEYRNDREEYIYPHITKWIKAFIDSDYVIVDSFHGCVFSIIFNKPFIAIGNVERGLTRFKSLLGIFNLEGRLITSNDSFDIDMIEYDYNWNEVNTIMESYQKLSKDFLANSFSGV